MYVQAKHTDAYCVTAAIERVDFLAPVEVGELGIAAGARKLYR
jgi:acyl-CoA hydrolase